MREIEASGIVLRSVAALLVGVLVVTWDGQVFATESVRHPMDPLTALEYSAVVTALKKENYVDDTSRYPLITLDEPAKAEVLQWKPGDAVGAGARFGSRDGLPSVPVERHHQLVRQRFAIK